MGRGDIEKRRRCIKNIVRIILAVLILATTLLIIFGEDSEVKGDSTQRTVNENISSENSSDKVKPEETKETPKEEQRESEESQPSDNTPQEKKEDSSADEKQSGSVSKEDYSYFNDAVFIGDSITEGIGYYNLVKKSRIIADKGLTLTEARKKISKIAALKPKRIYILLGTNDLLYGMDSKKYVEKYEELIEGLRERIPGAKIYVQSILPVKNSIEEKKPMLSNSRIDEFNSALKAMAAEKNIQYVNIAGFIKNKNGSLKAEYSSDGIHVKYKFYPIWLNHLKDIH